MYDRALESGADIVVCGINYIHGNKKKVYTFNKPKDKTNGMVKKNVGKKNRTSRK